MYAAINGHKEVVEFLLQKGAEPDARDKVSYALACRWKFWLISDVILFCQWGRTALMYAARNGHETVVEMLLQDEDTDIHATDLVSENWQLHDDDVVVLCGYVLFIVECVFCGEIRVGGQR
jgi:ankyrin repeat protein